MVTIPRTRGDSGDGEKQKDLGRVYEGQGIITSREQGNQGEYSKVCGLSEAW